MSSRIESCLRSVGIASYLFVLAGCAGFGAADRPPEEVVAERAQAWMDALVDGDIRAAYAFTSPGYRQFSDWGRYYARVQGAGRWNSAAVRDVVCTESACEVTVLLEYRVKNLNVDVRRPRTYKWVESKGNWWVYVPPG